MLDSPEPIPTSVSSSLTASILGNDGVRAVDLDLRYDSTSPYAVTATFTSHEMTVSWTFARDLLRIGLYEPVGRGDVHVRPEVDDAGHAAVLLELRSPRGMAIVMMPAREVHPFVESTTEAVRPGTESEHLDIDAAVHAVLVGGRPTGG